MALLFKDDALMLQCKCGERRMYKKEVFTYQKHKSGNVSETLNITEIRCTKCDAVVMSVSPEPGSTDKILT